MEGRLLLKDCAVLGGDGQVRSGLAVLVVGDRISRIAPDAELPVLPGDWEVACRGRLVTPGLVDCHAHLVSSQLFPSSGEALLRSPRARFERRLAREEALTVGEVEALTAHAIARALRAGVTMAVEHLACPSNVHGALDAQARTAARLGFRLAIAHATHSAGSRSAEAQIEENLAFARARKQDPWVRGLAGFHSASTISRAGLEALARGRDEASGVLFHLAESEDELAEVFSAHGQRVVPYLDGFGLLGQTAIAALARAVDRSEAARLAQSQTFVALSPGLDLLGEPGGGGFEALLTHPTSLGLGSGGGHSLAEQLQATFARVMHFARAGRLADPDGQVAHLLLSGSAQLCARLFSAPAGAIDEGALADLVVFDRVPEASGERLRSERWLELASTPVAWTIVGGRVAVREGRLVGSDFVELSREAAKARGGGK